MARIHGETIINRPREVVFDFVADERNRYDPRVRHAELISPGPIGVGSRFRSGSTSMVRTVEMIVEITAYKRPRLLASSTHLSLMDMTAVDPQGDDTLHRSPHLTPNPHHLDWPEARARRSRQPYGTGMRYPAS